MTSSFSDQHHNSHEERILIYYFAFPHYRISVLQELQKRFGKRLDLVSGSVNRGGLKALTEKELPGLQVVSSKFAGPFSWDHKVFRKAVSKHFTTVILAPAVSSVTTWATLVFRKLLRRKTLLWGQCGKPGDRTFKRLLQEVMNRMATGLLVYGSIEEAGAVELGTPSDKIHRVHNAVPLQALALTSEQLSQRLHQKLRAALTSGKLDLIYVGRINAGKNVEMLLQAGELLKNKYKNLSIRLIGDGPEAARLRNLYPDPRYEFLGAIYDKNELQKEIMTATFVVSPSTMGLLALDALSVGVPALVPDHPHNGSEVDSLTRQVNAFLFKPDSPQELSETVDLALQSLGNIDPESFSSSRTEGLQAWSPPAVADNIVSVLKLHTNSHLGV